MSGKHTPEADANARLIASAPALLDALVAIMNARDHYAEYLEYPDAGGGPAADQGFDDWAADLAEAAISSATGGE